jgi:hypothetical protein
MKLIIRSRNLSLHSIYSFRVSSIPNSDDEVFERVGKTIVFTEKRGFEIDMLRFKQ